MACSAFVSSSTVNFPFGTEFDTATGIFDFRMSQCLNLNIHETAFFSIIQEENFEKINLFIPIPCDFSTITLCDCALFFNSASSSSTLKSSVHSTGHVSSLCHKKDGPLIHLESPVRSFTGTPLDASSAGFIFVCT